MKIQTHNDFSFKTNYFHYQKVGNRIYLDKIITDNAEDLGKNPIVLSNDKEFPMSYDGKYYTSKLTNSISNYRIYYKDTNLYEKHGTEQFIDEDAIKRKIIIEDKIAGGQDLEYIIAKGKTVGKLLVLPNMTTLKKYKDEPNLIVLLENDSAINQIPPSNVRAIIMRNGVIEYLSHVANILRDSLDMASIVYDDEKIDKLKKLNDENISITNTNGKIEFSPSEIKEESTVTKRKITITPILETNSILSLQDCTQENCGNKAYRLKIMNEMAANGELKNIIIPKAFVLPYGYLKNLTTFLKNNASDDYEEFFTNPYKDAILEEVRKNGINDIIVRSAFNGEDTPNYSAAGLYKSIYIPNEEEIIFAIKDVMQSKNSPFAISSRKRNLIKDEEVQPTIIIQDYIASDYNFTLYTKDINDNLRIELKHSHYKDAQPAIISYDRKNNLLKLLSPQNLRSSYLVDEKYNIINIQHQIDELVENWQNFVPTLNNLVKNALSLEKKFKAAQDIEGGFKDGKLYLWQCRNIVQKLI